MKNELIYLAAPYSHTNKDVVEARIEAFCIVDAYLSNKGKHTVSPLLKHLVLQHSSLPGDWDYWKDYSIALLKRCSSMLVITLPGWEESVGLAAEMELCRDLDIPIELFSYNTVTIPALLRSRLNA